jgi:hypothetical protein
MITQAEVKALFNYDPESGWLTRKNGTDPESTRHKYFAVRIDGKRHYSHRIIWLWLYGTLPSMIDHRDGNGYNNRPENLREVTPSQSGANTDHGFGRGVESHGRKYRARIWVNNVRINLGSFDTFDEANEAYKNGSLKYFGEYSYEARP